MTQSVNGEKNLPRTVQIQTLEPTRFAPFGSYTNLIQPLGPQIGSSPITFYRDMLPLELAGKNPSFCVCRIEPRAGVIDVMEYHSSTGEGILPLDGDVLVQVAPATPRDAAFPAEEVRVFHVPRGTMLCLRPGVWLASRAVRTRGNCECADRTARTNLRERLHGARVGTSAAASDCGSVLTFFAGRFKIGRGN